VNAAGKKKGADIRVLDLRPVTSFADYFIICTGANRRQIQAIADEIERSLQLAGEFANSIEGYSNAEWVLMDYGDYVVHIFSETSRNYYDLERLWRDALVVPIGA
jgi:ribosome-associated protein